jgi:hypothetical protein
LQNFESAGFTRWQNVHGAGRIEGFAAELAIIVFDVRASWNTLVAP